MAAPVLDVTVTSSFDENAVNATPQLLFSAVDFSDADNDFNGGQLRITGALSTETIGIRSGDAISVVGGVVWYDADGAGGAAAAAIGTASGGAGSTFTVTFNGDATSAAIDALLENITYANSSNTPAASHNLTIFVTDAAGNGTAGPDGAWLFREANNPLTGVGGSNQNGTMIDFDGDGDLDIVAFRPSLGLVLLSNTGDEDTPAFEEAAINPFEALNSARYGYQSTPTMADVDGDGDLDLILAERHYSDVEVYYFENDGGAFVERTGGDNPFDTAVQGFYASSFSLAVADLDGDGDLDMVANAANNYASFTYYRNDEGVFTVDATPFADASIMPFGSTVLHDMDGDGDLDMVASAFSQTTATNKLYYYQNTGTATAPLFQWGGSITLPTNTFALFSDVTAADLNGDGHPEIIVALNSGGFLYFETHNEQPRPISVNVAPEDDPASIGGAMPATLTTTEDEANGLNLSAISLSDPENSQITVTLTVDAGLLHASSGGGVTVTGSGTSTLVLTGGANSLDAFLNGSVAFSTGVANANGAGYATVTATANAGGGDVALGTTTIDVTAVNDIFSLSMTPRSLTFGEDLVNATPQRLYADVTVTDVDDGFGGGVLTITGLRADDRLSLANGEHIALSAGAVWYDADGAGAGAAVNIGTVSGGEGDDFTVTFTADATAAGIEALIESVTYANVSDTPTAQRALVLSLSDGLGRTVGGDPSWDLGGGFGTGSGSTGNWATFMDYDGDGDLDMIVGTAGSLNMQVYRNTGTATAPVYGSSATWAIGTTVASGPATAGDLDGDGDMDLIAGVGTGIAFYRNDGTAAAPSWTRLAGVNLPFTQLSPLPGANAHYALVDLDGDGDLDIVAGQVAGTLVYHRNDGTKTAPSFTAVTTGSPFAGIDVGTTASPAFGDMDGDGDLDMVVGRSDNTMPAYFENTGTVAAPVFVQRTGADSPLGDMTNGRVNLVDYDNDGDLDLVTSWTGGGRYVWVNDSTFPWRTVVQVTDQAEGPTAGDDDITGTSGADTIDGLAGVDDLDGGDGDDTIDGGEGDDALIGGLGDDYLKGGDGADDLAGGSGDDTYVVDQAGDTVDETGGDGTDTVISRVSWTLGAGLENLTLGSAGGDTNGTGNSADNVITGNAGANLLDGLDGADTLSGLGGHDTLNGGTGIDILDGGGGNDVLNGGSEADTLTGGAGNDRLDGGTGVDSMAGGAGNDTYVLDDGADTVVELTGEGTDTVEIGFGYSLASLANVENLTLTGAAPGTGVGNSLANVITGSSGGNSLYGGDGNDTLYGGDGDDSLLGEAGVDRMHGGSGADWFMFAAGDNGDRILDLNFAEGDIVDLSELGVTAFAARFSKVAGQAILTYSATGNLTYLRIDLDGDGRHDLQFTLDGNHSGDGTNLYTGAGDTDGGWAL